MGVVLVALFVGSCSGEGPSGPPDPSDVPLAWDGRDWDEAAWQ